jgi:hypothetical protein
MKKQDPAARRAAFFAAQADARKRQADEARKAAAADAWQAQREARWAQAACDRRLQS